MKTRRTAKVAQAMLESISSTILFGLKDPRVRGVTVVNIDVSPDIRTAKVYVSIMGDEKQQSLCMHGLDSARGFLQSKCADRLQTRYTPVLKFILDESVKKSAEASRILKGVLPEAVDGEGDLHEQQTDEGGSEERRAPGRTENSAFSEAPTVDGAGAGRTD